MASNIRTQSTAGLNGATLTNIEYYTNSALPDEQLLCAAVIDLAAAASVPVTVFSPPSGGMNIYVTSVILQNVSVVSGASAGVTVRVNNANTVVGTLAAAGTGVGIVSNGLLTAATAVALIQGQPITVAGSGTTPTGSVRMLIKGVLAPNI